jgi:hypothetical protein
MNRSYTPWNVTIWRQGATLSSRLGIHDAVVFTCSDVTGVWTSSHYECKCMNRCVLWRSRHSLIMCWMSASSRGTVVLSSWSRPALGPTQCLCSGTVFWPSYVTAVNVRLQIVVLWRRGVFDVVKTVSEERIVSIFRSSQLHGFTTRMTTTRTAVKYLIFKNSVRTAKKTQHFTITKINWLTLVQVWG